ncbi:peptide chain release factor 1 [Buchnera aphidicola]|uniref:peptide chain release factor 1 n=1 Tax=Buchnera aphidicola TaxID=9 RepID=UPI003464C6A0
MESFIVNQLNKLYIRFQNLENLLATPKVIQSQEKFKKLSKEYLKLSNIISYFLEWKKNNNEINVTKTLLHDREILDMVQDELKILNKKNIFLETTIRKILFPKDLNDKKNCFIEIRAATGGDESAIFVGELFKMYGRYSEYYHWNTEIIHFHESEQGGFKDIIFKISGSGVFGRLKFESGGHRVQRIPKTESQGRIHTSTCTVAVMPEIKNLQNTIIRSSDLKIDTFRSSGAGGQHVNTTDSAIRITHIPTGTVVECQDERSQHKNKAKALSILSSRIHANEMAKQNKKKSIIKKNLLGTGDRSDRNRTYNFPKNRVTDHRINLTVYCLDDILNGHLDVLIEPMIREYYSQMDLKDIML